jgi:hypothetical protein
MASARTETFASRWDFEFEIDDLRVRRDEEENRKSWID